jgi:excinuclease UvrABC nuclease subunit
MIVNIWLETSEPRAREVGLRPPAAPGVYRFSDAGGRVLYLGRAVSLRRVVSC